LTSPAPAESTETLPAHAGDSQTDPAPAQQASAERL
jgi:hypothetical protein